MSRKDSQSFSPNLIYRDYLTFCLINFLFHILVLSFISFFHLLLEHPMSAIEDWFYRNGWEILILGKVMAVLATIRFRPKSWGRIKLKLTESYLASRFDPRVVVIGLLFYGVCFSFDEVVFEFENLKYFEFHLLSFVGVASLFCFDFNLLGAGLSDLSSLPLGTRLFHIIALSLLFTLFNRLLIPYRSELALWYFLHMAFMLGLFSVFRISWKAMMLFLVAFVSPLNGLTSLNFLWGDEYSFVNFGPGLGPLVLIPFQLLSLGYFYWTQYGRSPAIDTSIDYKSD